MRLAEAALLVSDKDEKGYRVERKDSHEQAEELRLKGEDDSRNWTTVKRSKGLRTLGAKGKTKLDPTWAGHNSLEVPVKRDSSSDWVRGELAKWGDERVQAKNQRVTNEWPINAIINAISDANRDLLF